MLTQIEQSGQTNKIRILIGTHTIYGICQAYENVRPNTPLGLIGSRGYLEVAVNKGNAARILNACKGDTVRVII
jgi:S-adenosylmethionine hydrolase